MPDEADTGLTPQEEEAEYIRRLVTASIHNERAERTEQFMLLFNHLLGEFLGADAADSVKARENFVRAVRSLVTDVVV